MKNKWIPSHDSENYLKDSVTLVVLTLTIAYKRLWSNVKARGRLHVRN